MCPVAHVSPLLRPGLPCMVSAPSSGSPAPPTVSRSKTWAWTSLVPRPHPYLPGCHFLLKGCSPLAAPLAPQTGFPTALLRAPSRRRRHKDNPGSWSLPWKRGAGQLLYKGLISSEAINGDHQLNLGLTPESLQCRAAQEMSAR